MDTYIVGFWEGNSVGTPLGDEDGLSLIHGENDGVGDGLFDGTYVGIAIGDNVGINVAWICNWKICRINWWS